MAAKWDEAGINEWMEKGRAVYRGIIEESTAALEKAEARKSEEVRVRLMENTRDELIDLASKVGDRTEDASESNIYFRTLGRDASGVVSR